MKAGSILNWKTALVLASVPFVAAWFQGVSSNASGGDMGPADSPSAAVTATNADDSSTVLTATDSTNLSQPSAATTPADLKLYGGTQEVVKLAQAGVGDDIILAFITNANVRFGVTPDQMIYLNDLGVSGTVVTAMMQHDAAATQANPPPAALASATAPGLDYANPPLPATDDGGMANPPPDYGDYGAYPAPYPGDNTIVDDTDYFYSPLQPYGSWIYVVGYGMCWQPTVCLRDQGWRPYFDRGRWLYSDCGWYWQSDYSWGWAAFHYGRWFCDDRRGWMWRPNRVWGPAWVAWRESGDYCGWAPLPPSAVFSSGIGFRFHNQVVSASFNFGLSAAAFNFIPIERFGDYAPSRYAAAPWQAERIFGESHMLNSVAIENKRVANLGMDPRLVDQRAGIRMRRAVIQKVAGTDANGRVQPEHLGMHSGSLVIYRPQLPSVQVGHGTRPAGGAGMMPPRESSITPLSGTPGTSWNSTITAPARTATVLGATGAEGSSPVHGYYVRHENPRPAGTYPPNSMVLEGRRNVTNPQWNSTTGQTPAAGRNNNYRPGSSAGYTVTRGSPGRDELEVSRSVRATGNGSTAGYQQYGNPYYRTHVAAVATPGPEITHASPEYNHNYRQPGYGAVPETSYRPATQPQQNYAPPVPRETYSAPAPSYSAPQPRQSYAPPVPRESYSAPAPRQSYSAPAQSPPVPSHSSSYSQPSSSSSSSSGSWRGR